MQMKIIARVLRPILTAIEYAIAVLIVAVTTQIIFGNNLQTWVITIVSISLAVFTSIIWYSDGVDRGENVDSVKFTTFRYHSYAKAILDLQDFDLIREFCVKKNEDYERELLSAKLSHYELSLQNLIDYRELGKKARETAIRKPQIKLGAISIGKRLHYTDEEFIKLRHRYTDKQLKVLEKYSSAKISFKHLQVKDVIRANDRAESLVPTNTEKHVLPTRIISKIIWGALLGLFTAGVVFTRKGAWTINETIQVISWAFSISLNIFTSIRSGYKSVTVNRYQYYKAKNEICMEFFAFSKYDKMNELETEIGRQIEQLKVEKSK